MTIQSQCAHTVGRRRFLRWIPPALYCAASAARGAKESGHPRTVGWLHLGKAWSLGDFRERLRELGWVEGTNIAIEARWADNERDRLPALAAELVARNVDVIVTQT